MNKLKEIIKNINSFLKKVFHFQKPGVLGKFKGNRLGILLVVLAVLLGALYYFRGFFIVATVNGQPVSRFEIIKRLEKDGGKTTLDGIVAEMLVLQEGKKLNALATQAEVVADIAKVKEELKASGQTLDSVLATQKITLKEFEARIMLQKTLEKILASKVAVTEDDITKFIESNKSYIPEGMEQSEVRALAEQNLKSQKLGTEFQSWLEIVKSKANINHFVKYE